MSLGRVKFGRGRWRLFRHDAGRAAGPPPLAYVLLYVGAQLVGHWSMEVFGATVLWLANAVLLAALLQLHRRPALLVTAACVGINVAANVARGDPPAFVWINAGLNLIQVAVAAVLARRFCGAALDMRRPKRLLRFVLLAVAPAVALSTLLAGMFAVWAGRLPMGTLGFRLHHLFDMELLAMAIVAPSLLLLARAHRFREDAQASAAEVAALLTLLAVVCLWVFGQTSAPILFMAFPPLILLAFRLSPPWTAAAVMMVGAIGGAATLTGHGPAMLTRLSEDPHLASVPVIMRQLNVFHLFLLAVVGTALPITTLSSERRRLVARLRSRTHAAVEARLRAEQADAAKSRFLALMSHEMRTPLTGVTGYADLLSRRPSLDAEGRRQVEAVRQCGEAMLRLVEDLLEVSRGGDEVVLAPVDVRDLMQTATAPAFEWAEIRGLDHRLTLAPEAEGAASIDARRLRQIVHHLTLNAAKFTSKGSISVTVDRLDDRLRVTVADTGCGMPPETLAGLFRLFEQADASTSRAHEGAGVGLVLAKGHIDRLGGTLSVESQQGRGSVFTVEIPAPAAASPQATATDDPPERRMRVLIVDDHPVNRDLLRIMMQAADCDVFEAADGREALDAVAARPLDLVLMDVRMPGMDGLAATRAIRALAAPARDIPVLAVTADAMPEDAARCLAAGMDGHLPKPVTQARLYEAVNAALEQAAVRQTAQDVRAA